MSTAGPTGPPMTAAEVATLRDGDEIAVLWAGGSGPHRYVVHEVHGKLYARSHHIDPDHFARHVYQFRDALQPGPLVQFGPERWQTKVWRA